MSCGLDTNIGFDSAVSFKGLAEDLRVAIMH